MPIDASIPLQVRTPEPGPTNLLDSLARVLQIKNEQARQQLIPGQIALQNQQVQLGQQQLDSTRVLNEAYKQPGMFTTGADGMPTMNTDVLGKYLSDNGQGHLVPSLTKTGLELNEQAGKVREQRSKLASEEADYAGLVGAGAITTGADGTKTADPANLSLGLAHAAAIYGPNSPSAQAYQALQQDPTKALGIAQHLSDLSPKQRELATAAEAAAARDLTAKTGKERENREAAVQQRAQALLQAGGVTDQASQDQWLARNPVLKSEVPPTYDPAVIARLAREAVPEKDRPEYDIKTQEAGLMAKMSPQEWGREVDGAIRDPKLNASVKAQLMAAPTWQAKQAVIRQAAGEQATLDRETNPAIVQTRVNQAVQIQRAVNNASGAAIANVPPHLVSQATGKYEKSGSDYANAVAAQQEMQDMVNLMRSGNKVAYAYSPVTGVLTINSANGTKRVNMAEIEQYGGAGSAWDRIKGFIGKQATGESIPSNVVDAMEEVHNTLGGVAKQKHANEVKVINQTYGAKFQPVELAPKADVPNPSAPALGGNVPTPASQAEFNALPKGAQFKKPGDPKTYIKQ